MIIGYIGIVFFGLGGLALIYWALKERLTGRPFLTITDEGIIYNGGWKQYDIRFADVHSFVLLGGRQNKFVGIRFKEGVERQKMDDASSIEAVLKFFLGPPSIMIIFFIFLLFYIFTQLSEV